MNLDIFSNQFLLELIVLVYSNRNDDSKRCKTRRYYLSKGFIGNYNVITNGKNFYDQTIDSDIKRYEEIRKLTTRQSYKRQSHSSITLAELCY